MVFGHHNHHVEFNLFGGKSGFDTSILEAAKMNADFLSKIAFQPKLNSPRPARDLISVAPTQLTDPPLRVARSTEACIAR